MSDNKSNTEMSNYCPNLTNTKLSPFLYYLKARDTNKLNCYNVRQQLLRIINCPSK